MLKRKIYDNLLNWKKNKKNECLIVNGARQIGKTFIIEQFGKKNYLSFISINFIKNPEYAEIFTGSLEPSEIYLKMSLLVPKIKFVENDTLIFFDEIQVCKNARTALKFLALDNKYDIICSGSLLGLSYNKSVNDTESVNNYVSIPVGYEREIEMFSLDFEEFLWACGIDESAIEGLRVFFDKKEHIDDSINAKFIDYIRKYLFVGGMPEVVNTFLESNNYQIVSQAQNKILRAYFIKIKNRISIPIN